MNEVLKLLVVSALPLLSRGFSCMMAYIVSCFGNSHANNITLPIGLPGSALSGGDQSCRTIRPCHSVESRSQTESKIESASWSHVGFLQSPSRSSAALMFPRLFWMVITDPTVIA